MPEGNFPTSGPCHAGGWHAASIASTISVNARTSPFSGLFPYRAVRTPILLQ